MDAHVVVPACFLIEVTDEPSLVNIFVAHHVRRYNAIVTTVEQLLTDVLVAQAEAYATQQRWLVNRLDNLVWLALMLNLVFDGET
jgi:hypothetical protein